MIGPWLGAGGTIIKQDVRARIVAKSKKLW